MYVQTKNIVNYSSTNNTDVSKNKDVLFSRHFLNKLIIKIYGLLKLKILTELNLN